MRSFASSVKRAEQTAFALATPFVPSVAEYLVSLQCLVDDMARRPSSEVEGWIRASYSGVGFQFKVVQMYKEVSSCSPSLSYFCSY